MGGSELAAFLKAQRARLGVSQNEAADMAGVPRSWLSVVELGRVSRPDPDRLKALARVLDVPPDSILSAAGYKVAPLPVRERSIKDLLREALSRIEDLESEIEARDSIAPRATKKGDVEGAARLRPVRNRTKASLPETLDRVRKYRRNIPRNVSKPPSERSDESSASVRAPFAAAEREVAVA